MKSTKEICSRCESNPIRVKKWELCELCYNSLMRSGKMNAYKSSFGENKYKVVLKFDKYKDELSELREIAEIQCRTVEEQALYFVLEGVFSNK